MESPNRTRYLPELHQLRGLAALLVFFYHAMHSGRSAIGYTEWPVVDFPPMALLWEGHTGVSLFLVLSGFILALGTFDKQISYRGFLERRIRRIVPLSLVVIVFGLYTVKDLDFGQVLAAVFLLRNSPASFNDPSGITGTLWTVAVEFQFYLVAPLVFAAIARNGALRFLLPLMALLFAMKIIVLLPLVGDPEEIYRVNYFTIVGRANQFLVGAALAYAVHLFPPQPSRWWWLACLSASSLLVVILLWLVNAEGGVTIFRTWHWVRAELEALVWAAFLLSFWMVNPIRWRPAATMLEFVGTVSFGLYVLHYAIQRGFWQHFGRLPAAESVSSLWQVALVNVGLLAACLAVAAASWFCIERPFVENRSRRAYVG